MDLKTISKSDYIEFPCEKTQTARFERKNNTNVLKFTGSSNYQSEYPNWGHYEFIHIGKFKTPYVSSGVKFTPQTTYSQFHSGGKKLEQAMTFRKNIHANPLTAAKMFIEQTTSKESFKDFGKQSFPERANNKALGIVPLESAPKSYETIYKTNFDWKSTPDLCVRKNGRL